MPGTAKPGKEIDQNVNFIFIIAAILVTWIPGSPGYSPKKIMQSVAEIMQKNSKSLEMLYPDHACSLSVYLYKWHKTSVHL